jgi:hypothetical protein
MTDSEPTTKKSEEPGVFLGNVGKPIKLSGIQLDGISAEVGRAGDSIKVWTRLALTSDDRFSTVWLKVSAATSSLWPANQGTL